MRYLLLSLFFTLVCYGTGFRLISTAQADDQVTIGESELMERDGIQYRMGSEEPFTGKAVAHFYDGPIRSETNYKDGRKDGDCITWFDNGRIRLQGGYKNGERNGSWIKRNVNGAVQFHRVYTEGKRVN